MSLRETLHRRRLRTTRSQESAWQIHAAMESWTGRADVKASVLLGLQGGGLIALFSSNNLLDQVRRGWLSALAVAGAAGLALAICLSVAVILPTLGSSRRHRAEHLDNCVYFGHLRHWQPGALAYHLNAMSRDDEAAMLARQLIRMSRLNWRKHRLLQVSVVLTAAVLLMFVLVVIITVGPWADAVPAAALP